MDTTKKSWKCDCCDKEYLENDGGYLSKYTITIESHSIYNTYKNNTYTDVCNNCVDAIIEILEPADIE